MTKSFYYIIFCTIFSSLSAAQQTKKRLSTGEIQAEILNGLKSGPCSMSMLLQRTNRGVSDYTYIYGHLITLQSKGMVNFEHVRRKLIIMLAQEPQCAILLEESKFNNKPFSVSHSLTSRENINLQPPTPQLIVSRQENSSMLLESSGLTSTTSTRDALLFPPIQLEEYDYQSQLPLEINNLPLAVQNLEGLL